MLQISYTKTFLKDLSKVQPPKRRKQIEFFVFETLPAIITLENSGNVEKLSGFDNYYKIRFGDYRIGLMKNGNNIEIIRVLNRKEIYKFFP